MSRYQDHQHRHQHHQNQLVHADLTNAACSDKQNTVDQNSRVQVYDSSMSVDCNSLTEHVRWWSLLVTSRSQGFVGWSIMVTVNTRNNREESIALSVLDW